MRIKAHGFTLLELLLVFVLIGIGTSVALISTNSLTTRAAEKQWGDRTQHVLRSLRNKAVLGSRSVLAEISFDAGSINSGGKVLMALPDGFRFGSSEKTDANDDVGEALPQLVFFPDGTMSATQFRLRSPSGMQEIFTLEGISGRISRVKLATFP